MGGCDHTWRQAEVGQKAKGGVTLHVCRRCRNSSRVGCCSMAGSKRWLEGGSVSEHLYKQLILT